MTRVHNKRLRQTDEQSTCGSDISFAHRWKNDWSTQYIVLRIKKTRIEIYRNFKIHAALFHTER